MGVEFVATISDEQVERIARRAAEIVLERTPNDNPLLDTRQAAAYLACDAQRIYDLVAIDALLPQRDGRRLLFRRAVLDAYVANGR